MSETTKPLSDGIYILSAGGAEGWTGPDGLVEIVTHDGNPQQWCYWLPDKNGKRPRCGMPLHLMAGAVFVSCLRIENGK